MVAHTTPLRRLCALSPKGGFRVSREALEKTTTYGPGGWRSRKRVEVRADVRRAVQVAARGGEREDGPAPSGESLLLERYIFSKGGSFKANPGKNGGVWYKASWAAGEQRVYVLVWGERNTSLYAALVDLCEVLQEVEWGLRKASPDRWGG